MTSDGSQEATALVVVMLVYAIGGLGFYVWYALGLSKVFARLGSPAWKAWVPVVNEMEVLTLGGIPAWNIVWNLVPIANLYGLYLRIRALSAINAAFGEIQRERKSLAMEGVA